MKNGNSNRDDDIVPSFVDESLIDAMMALSPEERLRQNDRMVRTVLLLREALAAQAESHDREG
jgi:hypothetical protein